MKNKYINFLFIFSVCLLCLNFTYADSDRVECTSSYNCNRFYPLYERYSYPDYRYRYPLFEYKIEFQPGNKINKQISKIKHQALHGIVDSQTLLSYYFQTGFGGIKKNLIDAYAWLKVAKESGHTKAPHRLNQLMKNLSPEKIENGDALAVSLRDKIQAIKEKRGNMFETLHQEQQEYLLKYGQQPGDTTQEQNSKITN